MVFGGLDGLRRVPLHLLAAGSMRGHPVRGGVLMLPAISKIEGKMGAKIEVKNGLPYLIV